MNANTSSQTPSDRDLRIRAFGQAVVISMLALAVLAAAALAGCDVVGSAATGTKSARAAEPVRADGGNGPIQYGFDWRRADPVTYSPEDWAPDADRPVGY